MADIRTTNVPAVWAENAQTTIPNPPVSGQSYRQPAPSPDDWKFGQAYDKIADSARYNAMWYIVTTLLQQLEQNGVLPYSQGTNYNTGALCLGTDNALYQSLKPSGPSQGGAQPTSNSNYWTKPLVQVSYSGSNSISVPAAGGAISLRVKTRGGIGVDSGGVFVNPDAFSTDLLNELMKQLRLPQYATRNLYLYVRPDGNDANAGTADTPEGAWKTIQYALTYVANNYNLDTYRAQINISAGIYSERITLPKYSATTGYISLVGAGKTSTIVRAPAFGGATLRTIPAAGTYRIYDIGFEATFPKEGGTVSVWALESGIYLEAYSVSLSGALEANTPASGIDGTLALLRMYPGSSCTFSRNSSQTATDVANSFLVSIPSTVERTSASTIFNVAGANLAFGEQTSEINQIGLDTPNTVASVANLGVITTGINSSATLVFTGNIKGTRYTVTTNSIISLRRGPNIFPGTVDGSTSSGGQYV